MHLTNVSVQKTAPDYDPGTVRQSEPAPALPPGCLEACYASLVIPTGAEVDGPAASAVPHREARQAEDRETV